MTGHPEGTQPVQDGRLVAGLFRHGGIGVERVVVAAEAVDQGGLGQGGQIANRLRGAFGKGVWWGSGHLRAAESAVPPGEDGLPRGKQGTAAGSLHALAFQEQQGSLVRAFVNDLGNAGLGANGPLGRKGVVKDQTLLPVQDAHPVQAGAGFTRPESWMAQHRRHGRQRAELLLVHEPQLGLVQRVHPQTQPEAVEHGVLEGVGLLDLRKLHTQQIVVIDRHGNEGRSKARGKVPVPWQAARRWHSKRLE